MIKNKLPKIRGEYRENFLLSPISWFKVGGPAEIFFKPADLEDLTYFLSQLDKTIDVFTIGAASNLLIRDGGIDGIVIKLGKNFANIEIISENKMKIGAACLNYNAAQFCYQNSIGGFEFLIGIPGSIGGGIAMNAGAYGTEFRDIIDSIEAVDREGKIHIIKNEDIGFYYRGNNLPRNLVFTSAIFNYKKNDPKIIKANMDEIITQRSSTQPIKEKTCGSTFANTPNQKVWKLIDEAGMRGAKVGDAEMSPLHCNFMINNGSASAKDLETLGEMIKRRVLEKTGIELHWEIRRVGKEKL